LGGTNAKACYKLRSVPTALRLLIGEPMRRRVSSGHTATKTTKAPQGALF